MAPETRQRPAYRLPPCEGKKQLLRYVLSAVSLALALLFFALGVGQRTIWAPPDSYEQSVAEEVTTPVLMLDNTVMTYHDGAETLEITADGPITVIVARTHDLQGWIGETPYTLATGGENETAELEVFDDGDLGLPNNLDNDLWQEFWQEEGAISLPMDLPLGTSVAVIGDGVEAAPSDVRVVWPNAATYPLFGPFMTAGFVLLAFSLLFLAIGLSNHRRKRGPQRATAKAISRRERRAIAKGKAPVVMASRQEQLTEAPVAEAVADNDQSSAATQTEPENETDSADKGQAEEPEGEDRA